MRINCIPFWFSFQPEMQRISSQVFNAVKDRLACRVGFFEIYGMDFMVDDAMKASPVAPVSPLLPVLIGQFECALQVWLIEINSNPAMNTNCEVLRQVIPPIVSRFIGKIVTLCCLRELAELPSYFSCLRHQHRMF